MRKGISLFSVRKIASSTVNDNSFHDDDWKMYLLVDPVKAVGSPVDEFGFIEPQGDFLYSKKQQAIR